MLERLLLAATLLLSPSAASAKWHRASSAHFVVYSDEDPEKLRAFAEKLERFDKTMRYVLKAPEQPVGLSNRLHVYVVPNIGAVQRLAGSGSDNVAGFYVGRATGSVAFVPRRAGSGSKGDLNADTIFFHEYAHHFMLGNFSGAFPAWYTEGFAEFYSTARIDDDGSVGIGVPAHHRAYGAIVGGGLPLARMLGGDYGTLDALQTETLYGRGWLLTHYLTFEPARSGQLEAYLKLIDQGKTGADAAKTAFGDLKQLDKDLMRYVNRPKMSYRKLGPGLTISPVTVSALRPGEAAFMPVRLRSVRGVGDKTAKPLVPIARRAAAAHPADPTVQAWLAEVEYDANNLLEAEAAADRALRADPGNNDAMIYKGRVKLRRAVVAKEKGAATKAMWTEARGWFVKASRADTEDAEPKVLYHGSFLAEGVPPTRNAVEALAFAQQLVPQDGGLRMQVVHQHLKDGKAADARRLLGPIAYNPHGGPVRLWAGKLMDRLAADDAKGALVLWNEQTAKTVE